MSGWLMIAGFLNHQRISSMTSPRIEVFGSRWFHFHHWFFKGQKYPKWNSQSRSSTCSPLRLLATCGSASVFVCCRFLYFLIWFVSATPSGWFVQEKNHLDDSWESCFFPGSLTQNLPKLGRVGRIFCCFHWSVQMCLPSWMVVRESIQNSTRLASECLETKITPRVINRPQDW